MITCLERMNTQSIMVFNDQLILFSLITWQCVFYQNKYPEKIISIAKCTNIEKAICTGNVCLSHQQLRSCGDTALVLSDRHRSKVQGKWFIHYTMVAPMYRLYRKLPLN